MVEGITTKENLKRENERHLMQSKQEQFPCESLRLSISQASSDVFPKIQELALKENYVIMCDPTLYSRRGDYRGSLISKFPAITTSFDASLGYKKSSRRNLSRNGNGHIFLEAL
jgi:hypothetical protein